MRQRRRRCKKNNARRTTVDFSFISWNPPGGLKSFDVTGTVTPGRAVPGEKRWSCAFPCTPSSSPVPHNVFSVFPLRSLRERESLFPPCATNVNTITTLCRSCHVRIAVSYSLHHRQRAFFQRRNFPMFLSATIFPRTRLACAYLIIVAKLHIDVITKSVQKLLHF